VPRRDSSSEVRYDRTKALENAYDLSQCSSRIAHACGRGTEWCAVAGIGYDGHERGFIGQTLLIDGLFLSDFLRDGTDDDGADHGGGGH
jgi:hypothetical protein